MSYVWEEELMQANSGTPTVCQVQHHLKKVWNKDPLLYSNAPVTLHGTWKVSVAWVTKEGDRKWRIRFAKPEPNDKTFRSLKAAKAYALAIVTLEQ